MPTDTETNSIELLQNGTWFVWFSDNQQMSPIFSCRDAAVEWLRRQYGYVVKEEATTANLSLQQN